jgi:two-component system cell cycle sensor histidine kinase/response regulator CckA
MNNAAERKRARLLELEAEAERLRAELSIEAPTRLGPLRAGLSKREALLVEAERVAHLGSWAWDLRTQEIGWSDEFYRILGLDPALVEPSSPAFFGAIHPEDRERVEKAAQEGLSSGNLPALEFRIVRPDGELRELRMEGALLHDDHGQQVHVVGAALDITEQRRAARLLARTVAELNEAHHIAGLASWRWDAFASQLEWSEGMYRLLDVPLTVTPSEALFYRFVHPEDRERVRTYSEQALTVKGLELLEFRIVRSDGRVLDVALRVVSQWGEEGALLGFRGVIQDVTERKALEEQLRHSQKMEAVGTLAGGVAHDFNNYLMVIAGNTELLAEQFSTDDRARESVDAIAEAYQRCAHLTQQLLTLSRKRKPRPVIVDLTVLVNGLASLIRSVIGETISLRLELAREGATISADPLQVEQALMNLVMNARDAMPRGGELSVRVEARRDRATDRPHVRLTVADTGTGIPPELRSRIFEPFFTTKQVGQGTGLGLSTVYAIVRDAGALIDFTSEPGRGSEFFIDWPRYEGAGQRKSGAARAAESLSGRKILLVEDVARVRELLAAQLERAGYKVISAPHGIAALEHLERERVDLVLSDMVMPQLGGIGLAEEVRARYPMLPCLLMTGYSSEALSGGDVQLREQVLRKPFTTVELLQAVSRLLGARKTSADR